MKSFLRKIFKWVIRIFLGLLALLVLLLLLFYLFRGRITDKALSIINESQPGTASIAKVNILPFLYFPDLSFQLNDLLLLNENEQDESKDAVPVIRFDQVFVSVNIRSLMKGDYQLSNVRLGAGEINYIVGEDSISNLEKALGISFKGEQKTDTMENEGSPLLFNLEKLLIRDLAVNYLDIPGGNEVQLNVNGLETGFSYNPDTIMARLMTHMNIHQARVGDILLDKPRELSFSSAMVFDQMDQKIDLGKSMLDLKDATFELEGELFLEDKTVDISYSAKNRGIALLNFLFNGILKLDVIEQTGDGIIEISGNARGSFDDLIPRIELNFMAEDVGFLIHSIDQEVKGIRFEGYASNGDLKDLSQAIVQIEDFHVDFPEGSLDANIRLSNLKDPDLKLEIDGNADLAVLNEILETESIQEMQGMIHFTGLVDGEIDYTTETFLENAGTLELAMENVGFQLPGNTMENLNGTLVFRDEIIELDDFRFLLDENDIRLGGEVKQLLPFLLGFNKDPSFSLALSSNELNIDEIIGDTLLNGPLRNLEMNMSLLTSAGDLKAFIDSKKIPEAQLIMNQMDASLPGYADLRGFSFILDLKEEEMKLRNLQGKVGNTEIDFEAEILNYNAFLEKDSSAAIGVEFNFGSERMFLSDLLTINENFTGLPENFEKERIDDFRIKVKVETSVGDLLKKNELPNVRIYSDEMHWEFTTAPLSVSDFAMDVELRDSTLLIRQFQGSVGESNLELKATVSNLLDSSKVIKGSIEARSKLLDLNQLLSYELFVPAEKKSNTPVSDSVPKPPPDLSQFDYPDIDLEVDVNEFRFEGNELFNLKGALSLRSYKILYLSRFMVQTETGGSIVLDGQFNVSDPELYMLSANMNIDTVNVSDFDLQIAIEDTVFSLADNFNGLLSTDGIAEFFINPDLSVNVDYSTAMFNLRLEDGRVKNFTPLQALGKFTGNKDLNNIKFGLLRNSFTLIGGSVQVPLMSIESNLGLILLEGEHSLAGDFLYLARVPTKLVRGTAWNMVSNQQRKEAEETEIQRMQQQKFLLLTISSKQGIEDVKMGDKRDRFE